MRKFAEVLTVITMVLISANALANYTVTAGQLNITLNGLGQITGLTSKIDGKNYVSTSHSQSLIQLIANGSQQLPTSLAYDAASSTYDFNFGLISTHVYVQVTQKPGYATLSVKGINAPANVDVSTLFWGPIATNITQTVGEVAGVVYNNKFAIGIHQLNNKTVGGWPTEYVNLSYQDGTQTSPMALDWLSASHARWGSFLQSYTYDYTKARHRTGGFVGKWLPDQPISALSGPDAIIPGSAIALFGCNTPNILNTISDIEIGEGLPHPMINGQWQKTAQATSQSYLWFEDLSTSNVAQASQYANKAGVNYIYSAPGYRNGPWISNGHFQFNSLFGGSDSGAKQLVSTAASYGVKVGTHTISDFIDTNDAYVTPIPNEDLVSYGSVTLTRNIGVKDADIYVNAYPLDSTYVRALLVDKEIIAFNDTTKTQISPTEWKIGGITRAQWGTEAVSHKNSATAYNLVGNQYYGLVGGVNIVKSIASRLSQVFNATGIKAMSFDGLESTAQIGYGTYPGHLLVNSMYKNLASEDGFISEASNLYPNTWDAMSRISWGEGQNGTPLQQIYDDMAFYQRNFFPAMIGQPVLHTGVSPYAEEQDLSRMASWNAGAEFLTNVSSLNAAGNTEDVLGLINEWETARNSGAFSDSQKAEMRDPSSHWHLENVVSGKSWNLYKVQYQTLLSKTYTGTRASSSFTNVNNAQPLRFELYVSDAQIVDPSFTIGGVTMTFKTTIPPGGVLVCSGTASATVYDSTWHALGTVTATGTANLSAGTQTVTYDSGPSPGATARIVLITWGGRGRVSSPAKLTNKK